MSLDGDYKVDVDNKSDDTSPEMLNNILGGKNIRIDPYESIDVHESNVPSPTFSGFLTELDRSGSLGVLPYEFIWLGKAFHRQTSAAFLEDAVNLCS